MIVGMSGFLIGLMDSLIFALIALGVLAIARPVRKIDKIKMVVALCFIKPPINKKQYVL
jgi:hypothetical protein